MAEAGGDYLTGDAGVYVGTARVQARGEWIESFEHVDTIAVVWTWLAGTSEAQRRFASYVGAGTRMLELRQGDDAHLLQAYFGSSSTATCPAMALDLTRLDESITTQLSCERRSDAPIYDAEISLDFQRIPPEELTAEQVLTVNHFSRWRPTWDEEVRACGAGLVREEEVTFEERSWPDPSGGYSVTYVDTRTTWYIAEACPRMHGVARIEIIRAESCSCPPDGHCHGRYDENCRCIGERYDDDPICR